MKDIRNRIRFDAGNHSYSLLDENGGYVKPLDGVTTVLSRMHITPDYSIVNPEVLKKACDRGTAFHELCRDYDDGLLVDRSDPKLNSYTCLDLNVVASEWMVSDFERVASFIDKVILKEDGTYAVADIKTTSALHREAVRWQCSIYAYLLEKNNADTGLRVSEIACIHAVKDKVVYIRLPRRTDEEVEELLDHYAKGETEWLEEVTTEAVQRLPHWLEEDLDTGLRRLAMAQRAVKEAEESVDSLKGALGRWMTDNEVKKFDLGDWSITRVDDYETSRLDSTRLKKEEPGTYRKFLKTTTVKGGIRMTQRQVTKTIDQQ